MTRKKHASKAERQIRRERLKDDQKRDLPPDLGKRTVQGVLIDEEQWEGHDL